MFALKIGMMLFYWEVHLEEKYEPNLFGFPQELFKIILKSYCKHTVVKIYSFLNIPFKEYLIAKLASSAI